MRYFLQTLFISLCTSLIVGIGIVVFVQFNTNMIIEEIRKSSQEAPQAAPSLNSSTQYYEKTTPDSQETRPVVTEESMLPKNTSPLVRDTAQEPVVDEDEPSAKPSSQSVGVEDADTRDTNGPQNDSIHITTSLTPAAFDLSGSTIFEQASTPDAVVLHTASSVGSPGDVLMYYSSFKDAVLQEEDVRIHVARSIDNGLTWIDPQRIVISGDLPIGKASDSAAVQLEDGSIRLFFYGPSEADVDPALIEGEHSMYSAVSSDGVNFVMEDGVRFAYNRITDPEVVKLGDKWIMYASAGNDIIVATSEDGLEFLYTSTVRGIGSVPGAYVEPSTQMVYVYGCNNGDLYMKASVDGVTFNTNTQATPVLESGKSFACDPSPVVLSNGAVGLIYKQR